MRHKKRRQRRTRSTPRQKALGWEYVSKWYDGMVGEEGSIHHAHIMPTVLELLSINTGDHILDLGCGQGVLAPHVKKAGGQYTGVDISPSLVRSARSRHSKNGTFIEGDVHNLKRQSKIRQGSFESAVFLLSIQDMRYPKKAIDSAAWSLKDNGRIVILMTHPAFRIPRQSGWGQDSKRKLIYRRIDSYLSPLDVPLKKDRRTGKTLTRSYHRPLQTYLSEIFRHDLVITDFREIPAPIKKGTSISRAEVRVLKEIPLFLAISAMKLHKVD